jgi:8-oxo-dGTP diphosphatase
VYFHGSAAPTAAVVLPSVFVAVRDGQCRCAGATAATGSSPGGRVDVGESAVDAALRETAEPASPESNT